MKRLVLSFVLLMGCFYTSIEGREIQDQNTLKTISPAFAKQKTAKLILENGLEAYLVSNPTYKESAVALTVGVGSWFDPENAPGMAHFLEHLLFLGTEKYPDEASFAQYVDEHNGTWNAFTEGAYTTYGFSIQPDGLREAMDRFSQFFIAPLFNPSGVDRELNAIQQEYQMDVQRDPFRRFYVQKALGNPKHPDHRFGIGNKETLSKVRRKQLIDWYEHHYSADYMKLVVFSSLPIEELKKIVESDFSGVPNRQVQLELPQAEMLQKENDPLITYIKPVKEARKLTMYWELPKEVASAYDSRPDDIASHIIGHEADESLYSQLRYERLADTVSSGSIRYTPQNAIFYLQIDLTPVGVTEVDRVIDRVFQTITYLKETGIPEYIFDEVQQNDVIQSQYPIRKDAFELAIERVRQLRFENLETFPMQSDVLQRFDPEGIQKMLSVLTPENAHIDLQYSGKWNQNLTVQTEPWLGVPYARDLISTSSYDLWKRAVPHPHITIPKPNPYLSQHLELIPFVPVESEWPKPKVLDNSDNGLVYYSADHHYLSPQVYWSFQLKTPTVVPGNPLHAIFLDLIVKAWRDAATGGGYQAKLAHIDYEMQPKEDGVQFMVHGYSAKAPLLVHHLLQTLKNLELNEEDFRRYIDRLANDYENFFNQSPIHQGIGKLREALYFHYVTNCEKKRALRKATFKDFQGFVDQWLDQLYSEVLLYGNIQEKDASQLWKEFQMILGAEAYPKEAHVKRKVVLFSDKRGPYFLDAKARTGGNASILVIEEPGYSFQEHAAHEIATQALKHPFFSELRTKQQTAYMLTHVQQEIEGQLFSIFAIESHSHDVRDLLARIELFIESAVREFRTGEFSEERFDRIRESFVRKLSQYPDTLKEMGKQLLEMAFTYDGDFDFRQKRLKGFEDLHYDEFLSRSASMLSRENKRRLAILMRGSIPKEREFRYQRAKSMKWLKDQNKYVTWEQVDPSN